PRALALAEEAMKSTIGSKGKLLVLLLALGLAVGAGVAGYDAWVAHGPPEPPATGVERNPPKKDQPGPLMDLHADPLPAGAVARLGTLRWRHAGQTTFAAFLPDGKTVLSAGADFTLRVWEYPSGKELRRISAPVDEARAFKSPAANLPGPMQTC